MFEKLGRFVARTWPAWIIFWIAALLVANATAPQWQEVTSEGELEHLPPNTPTRIGHRLYDRAFPNERTESSIVVILSRDEGELAFDDFQFVAERLTPGLKNIAQRRGGLLDPSLLTRADETWQTFLQYTTAGNGEKDVSNDAITLPSDVEEPEAASTEVSTPHTAVISEESRIVSIAAPHNSVEGPLLVSEDRQAMVVLVGLTFPFLSSKNKELIDEVERTIEQFQEKGDVPLGLDINLSGSAVVGRDVYTAVTASTNAIRRWTVWLVLALLLIVFRAPVISLIPLATLYCAVNVSLDLMASLAAGGHLDIYDGLKVYATVLIYGAGVDYSLFLISRHAEELSQGKSINDSIVSAVSKVGPVVAISAATEIFAIYMLSWSKFGKFVQAGQVIPLGLAIALAASLTLTFALLKVSGRWGFWPLKLRKTGKDEALREEGVKRYPERGITGKLWSNLGRFIERRPITCWVATVAILTPLCLVAAWNSGNVTYDMVNELPADSASIVGNRVLTEHFPAGITGPTTVLLRNDGVDFASEDGIRWIEQWGNKFEQENPDLKIEDVRSVANPLGVSERFVQRTRFVKAAFPDALPVLPDDDPLIAADSPDPAQVEAVESALGAVAATNYVSHVTGYDGHVTQVTLVLDDDPFTRSSIERIDQLRTAIPQALPAEIQEETVVFLMGPTASLFDVKTVADQDRRRLYVLVTLAVFLVLWILLRDVVITIYLVVTVLFTYLVTMGATYLTFSWIEGGDFVGLEWTAPVLLFTLLMAVGTDYNVFLVQRFREEYERRQDASAVTESLMATGGLISGAGVVMAGTFSILIWAGTLGGLHQLGFALTLGVLVDTFLVRPILVPAFLTVRLDKWKALRELLPGGGTKSA